MFPLQASLQDLISLTGFSEADAAVLASYAQLTSQWTEDVVKAFYDTVYGYEPTAKILQGEDRAAREQTLRAWYLEVTQGKLDSSWWNKQWLVGLVHIKRKVSNAFMLGMMSRVQQLFLERCLGELPAEQAKALYAAFKRATDVVAGLVAEGYFENYFIALERTVGFKRQLIQRMLDVEVNKMLQEAKTPA